MKAVMRYRSALINLLLVAAALVLLLVPDAKSALLSGFIKIGFHRPAVGAIGPAPLSSGDDVEFTDGSGKTISLGQLKGKVVFINFWTTWCPPCRAEMPAINSLYEQFRTDGSVAFIMVDADGNYEKAQRFLKKKSFDFPLYIPASSIPANLFEGKLPTTIVINKTGKIAFRHEGMADYSDRRFVEFLERLKNE